MRLQQLKDVFGRILTLLFRAPIHISSTVPRL